MKKSKRPKKVLASWFNPCPPKGQTLFILFESIIYATSFSSKPMASLISRKLARSFFFSNGSSLPFNYISSWCNIMLSSHKASNNLWPISVCMPLIHCRFHRFYGELLLHRCIIFIATILMFKTSTIDRCCILCHS